MSLEHAYCSLEALKARLGLRSDDSRDDEALEGIIETVSRLIDAECESQFYTVSETRYFAASSDYNLVVDDFVALTSIATDLDGDGTFETSWDSGDFVRAPYNAPSGPSPKPYWSIEATTIGGNRFPLGARRGVQVVADWGYCTDANRPKQVETVCLREALYAFTASRTPYGMTTGDGNTAIAPSPSLSEFSRSLLQRFRRVSIA